MVFGLPITTQDEKKESPFWSNKGSSESRNFFPTFKQLGYLPKVFSAKERWLVIILFLIAMGSLISLPLFTYRHFTHEVPDYGGSITEGMVGNPRYINPLLAQTNDVDRDLTELIYSGLLKYDENGKLIPDLAESYSISDDGLSYVFKLKKYVKWHDGNPLTPDDVVFTINTAQSSEYGSPQRINWQGVEVNKIDDNTILFKLKNKYGQFLNNMTLGILPRHAWIKIKAVNFALSELNNKPIGSGPYRFVAFKKNDLGQIDSYKLTAFKDYFGKKPFITNITAKFYSSEENVISSYNRGEIGNLSFVSADKIKSIHFQSKLNIHNINLPRYFAVFFNQNKSKSLSDPNIRIAINLATDKNAIIEKILNGKGQSIDSPMMPGILDIPVNKKNYTFDVVQAKALLTKNGWQYSDQEKVWLLPGKKSTAKNATTPEPTRLEIELTTSDWPELLATAIELKAQWEEFGARVNIKTLALSELQQSIRERNYEALLFGEVLNIDPDPFSFWHSSQKRDPGLNLALFDNKDSDKLLEDARQENNFNERKKKYAQFQDIVIDQAPAVFLYSSNYIYPQAKKVKDNNTKTIYSPANRFDSIKDWYIDTKRVFK